MAEVFYPRQEDYIYQLNKLADSATMQQSYYGAFASPPATRPDGTPRRVGDRYFDTTANSEMTWNGTAWAAAGLSGTQLAAPDGATRVGYTTPSGTVTTVDARLKKVDAILAPSVQNRKIVVLGSSVALGQGSPTYTGWASRLSSALTPRGYTLVNKSISGNKSADCIGRFYTDVVPENPEIVIIALSIANEGLIGSNNKQAVYNTFIAGIRRLVAMCREMGYKAIVTGTYPNNDYTAEDYMYALQANQEFENEDFQFINFMGTVDNGSGKWNPSTFTDAGHPNDAGHLFMYGAFDITSFAANVSDIVVRPQPPRKFKMVTSATATGVVPMQWQSQGELYSFTIMATIRRRPGATPGRQLIVLESSLGAYQTLRVRNSTDEIEFAGTNNLMGTLARTSTNAPINIILTFLANVNRWTIYIDGVVANTVVYGPQQTVWYNRVVFGGRNDQGGFETSGYEFSDLAVWRTALNPDQAREAYMGIIPKGSLAMYSPSIDAPNGKNSRLVNFAESATYVEVMADGVTGELDERLFTDVVAVRPRDGNSGISALFSGQSRNVGVAGRDYESLRIGIGESNGVSYAGSFSWFTSAGNNTNPFTQGYTLALRAVDNGSNNWTANLLTISGTGDVTVPAKLNLGVSSAEAQGTLKLEVFNSSKSYVVSGAFGSAAGAAINVATHSVTGASIRTGGTVNTGGTDYAEYFRKCITCLTVLQGQLVGITADNEITDRWDDSVMFAIKSTNPSFVGGDDWASHLGERPKAVAGEAPILVARVMPKELESQMTEDADENTVEPAMTGGDSDEEWAEKVAAHDVAYAAWSELNEADKEAAAEFEVQLEAARERVDRIAISGRVPVNVYGAKPGDYIVPVKDGVGIKGIAVSEDDVTLKQYLRAVGQVIMIEEDERAYVMVKSV